MGAFEDAQAAATALAERTGVERHDVLVVLGSGWGDAVDALGEVTAQVRSAELPGFPEPTVAGHGGQFLSIDTGARRVLVSQGRVHLYEGHESHRVVHGVRTGFFAGCRVAILTNAAGSLREDVGPGTGVLLSDHLNLTGVSALDGPLPPEPYDTRFVDQTNVWTPGLRKLAATAAEMAGTPIAEGVYAGLRGPFYETPAEIRMLRTLGADLVGMSTVLEAQAASHLGMAVLGLSLVTNLAAGMQEKLDHAEVLDEGQRAAAALGGVLRAVVDAPLS